MNQFALMEHRKDQSIGWMTSEGSTPIYTVYCYEKECVFSLFIPRGGGSLKGYLFEYNGDRLIATQIFEGREPLEIVREMAWLKENLFQGVSTTFSINHAPDFGVPKMWEDATEAAYKKMLEKKP